MLAELEDQVAGEVFNWRYRSEGFGQTLGLEPIEAGLLQFDEVGDFEDVRNLSKGKTIALGSRFGALLDRKCTGRHRKRRRHYPCIAVASGAGFGRRRSASRPALGVAAFRW